MALETNYRIPPVFTTQCIQMSCLTTVGSITLGNSSPTLGRTESCTTEAKKLKQRYIYGILLTCSDLHGQFNFDDLLS